RPAVRCSVPFPGLTRSSLLTESIHLYNTYVRYTSSRIGSMAQISHKEQLIEGAIECLQTKGYARTTARDIAAASSANLASIGYHFGSKESLLNEALMRILEERNRRVAIRTFSAEA